MPFTQNLSANQAAFLDTIAWSEIGPDLLAISDNGYNVLVGSTPAHPLLFASYVDHPRILNKQFDSTAAGVYQIIEGMFDAYRAQLGLPDFSPASQDAIALQMLRERGILELIDQGNFSTAVARASAIWASFPGSSAGQHTQALAGLTEAFTAAGGFVAVS